MNWVTLIADMIGSHNIKYAIYTIFIVVLYMASRLLAKVGGIYGEVSIKRLIQSNLIIAWRTQKKALHIFYTDQETRELLQNAGFPKWATDVAFQLTRDLFIALSLIFIHIKWVLIGGGYPLFALTISLGLYVALLTNKGFPLNRLLVYLEQRRKQKKNVSIHMLFMLFLNEYAVSGTPTTVYHLLKKFRPYFPLLQSAFDLAIRHYSRSPEVAMEAFAKDIGTSQAKELAALLVDIDQLSPEEAYMLLEKKYEYFNTLRIEEFRRRNQDRGLIGYFLTFVPAASIILLFGITYYLEYKDLTTYMNSSF